MIAVLADLGSQPVGDQPVDGEPGVSEPVDVTFDSLDEFIASRAPELSFRTPNTLVGDGEMHVVLHFRSMQDFRPERLIGSVSALHKLHEVRTELAELRLNLARDPQARLAFDQAMREVKAAGPAPDRGLSEDHRFAYASASAVQSPLVDRDDWSTARPQSTPGGIEVHASAQGVWSTRALAKEKDVLVAALSRTEGTITTRLTPDRAESVVDSFIQALAANPSGFGKDVLDSIDRCLYVLDDKVSTQLDEIYHAEVFQSLEASWRGLEYLLRATQHCTRVKVRVLAVSRDELQRQLGANDPASPLRRNFGLEHAAVGHAPASVLLANFEFGPGSQDIALLTALAKFAAAIHAPCLAGALPELLGAQKFRDLGTGFELTDWLDSDVSMSILNGLERLKSVGLVVPHVLMRKPFTRGKRSAVKYTYSESPSSTGAAGLWGGAAWCLAAGLAQTFERTGWFHDLGELSAPTGLDQPANPLGSHGPHGMTGKLPPAIAEARLTDSQCTALARFGMIPLRELAGADRAMLVEAPTLYRPRSGVDDTPLASPDWLSTLTVCRIAHHLRCLIQERRTPFMGTEACETLVRDWLQPYLAPDGLDGLDADRFPIRRAEVVAEAEPVDPAVGWCIRLSITPAHVRSDPVPVNVTLALPADRIVSLPDAQTSDWVLSPLPFQGSGEEASYDADARTGALASSGRSARLRFMARLLIAERAVANRKLELAGDILEDLAAQIERLQLQEWEDPRLVVKVWLLLRQVYASTTGRPDAQERSAILLRQICKLDPSAAIEAAD